MTRDEMIPSELGEAYAANLHELFLAMGRLPGATIDRSPGLSRHHAPFLSPMFAGVWGEKAGAGDAAARVDDSVAWLSAQGAPMAFWWTHGPPAPPLADALEGAGFVPFEVDAPVLGAAIDDLRWDTPRPPGLCIVPVEDAEGLEDWARMFVQSFEIPAFAAHAWVDATLAIGIDRARWRMMVARIDDVPVGSAMLFVGAGVAGLIQMGVVRRARRKGVGAALQLERLRLARELGCTHVVLSAAAMGLSPYTKLGLRDTGARVSRFMWRPGDAEAALAGRTWREGN